MILKKYENLIQNLNNQLQNGTLDIKKNNDKLKKIIDIYKLLKSKKFFEAKIIIDTLDIDNLIQEKIKEYDKIRNWNINGDFEEDNVEAFNSIEMMSGIFLENLKEYSKDI